MKSSSWPLSDTCERKTETLKDCSDPSFILWALMGSNFSSQDSSKYQDSIGYLLWGLTCNGYNVF